jgi:pilus assembly protein Flp/PilA
MSERISAEAATASPRHRAALILRRFAGDCRGSTAIEYAMIGGLIFAVIAGSLKLYGSRLNGVYTQIGNAMAQVN